MVQRAEYRRRRSANLRYRASRFDNRRRPEGWLAPSLQHRVDTTTDWVRRLCRIAPVRRIDMELVKFDMQVIRIITSGLPREAGRRAWDCCGTTTDFKTQGFQKLSCQEQHAQSPAWCNILF